MTDLTSVYTSDAYHPAVVIDRTADPRSEAIRLAAVATDAAREAYEHALALTPGTYQRSLAAAHWGAASRHAELTHVYADHTVTLHHGPALLASLRNVADAARRARVQANAALAIVDGK